jgi:hypothetical protein
MAGGGMRRGLRMPLEDRVAASSAADVGRSAGECPARHCWVLDAADLSGVRRPGLLVEWRRREGGWEGRVVYAASLRARGWALVEEWVPAGLLVEA